MLDDTLQRRRHGSRLKDIGALLALRPCRPADFGAAPQEARQLAQRRARLRSRRIREAALLAKIEAILGADAEGGCVLVLRVPL